jgi:type VI secretion system secreted protein Hcp
MKLRYLLVCAGLLISVFPACAAVDYFLKLEGIPGESLDDRHKDEIEILSFSFGATQTGGITGGGGAGKVIFSDISFTKPVDKSSPQLYLQCAQGKHIPTAILYGRKAGERPTDYYIIKLTDVLISSVQTSGASGGDRPTESLSLNFTKIEFSYARQKPDGSFEPPIQTGWDIKLNVAVP